MASALYRLGRFAFRKHWIVIVAWLIIFGGVIGAAQAFQGPTSTSFTIPGIASVQTQDKLTERFAGAGGDPQSDPSFTLVMQSADGSALTSPANQEKVQRVVDELRGVPDIANPDTVGLGQVPPDAIAQMSQMPPQPGQPEATQDWLRAAQAQNVELAKKSEESGVSADQAEANANALSTISPDGRYYRLQAAFDKSKAETAMDVTDAQREAVEKVAQAGDDAGLKVAYEGQAMQKAEAPGGASELIGMAVALIVLSITFSSIVGAVLPLLTAIVGVGIAVMSVTALSGVVDVSDMTPMLATMLGLAVAIDYSLFIASRYRHEIRLTDDRSHAAGRAVGTAGSSVTFAGTTVFIALVALSILRIPFLTTMALAAAGAVVLAVLIALTLLPALFGALGGKVFALRIPGVKAPDPEDEGVHTMGERLAKGLRRHPIVTLIGGVVVLAVLALPVGSMRLALPTDSVMPSNTPQRQAVEMVAAGWGPGANAPMVALVDTADIPQDQRMAAYEKALEDISATPGVANAQLMATNGAPPAAGQAPDPGDAAQIMITPTTGPVDEATTDTLQSLRDGQSAFTEQTGASYGVTGLTPIEQDISERLSDSLAPYLAIVIGLAFILLMIVFRSLLVPLIAALGFLLSVAATFGATVAIFQWGWFGIAEGEPLVSFLPIFLIGLVFGLAMDYQVFLVSRMREAYTHGAEARDAVVTGYKYGARVVTAAALIMMAVFSAFIGEDAAFIKSIGFALGAAVLFDAFVVRMLIVPSIMFVLGDRAWWLPRWLEKILPKIDVEGEKLLKSTPARAD